MCPLPARRRIRRLSGPPRPTGVVSSWFMILGPMDLSVKPPGAVQRSGGCNFQNGITSAGGASGSLGWRSGPWVARLHERCSGPRQLRCSSCPRSQRSPGWMSCPQPGRAQRTVPVAMRLAHGPPGKAPHQKLRRGAPGRQRHQRSVAETESRIVQFRGNRACKEAFTRSHVGQPAGAVCRQHESAPLGVFARGHA